MLNTNWVDKLQLEVRDEEDGGCTIIIEWDETDPDLTEWISWGPEGQEQFILDALKDSLNNVSATEHHVI